VPKDKLTSNVLTSLFAVVALTVAGCGGSGGGTGGTDGGASGGAKVDGGSTGGKGGAGGTGSGGKAATGGSVERAQAALAVPAPVELRAVA